MKKLLALLFALLATPAAAQTIPSGAWGSINYWGVGGLSQVLAPGLAGQCLTSQNVGSAPIWVNCQVSALSLLPPINANSIMANNTLNFVAPQAIDVNRVLDMVGYDIIRPPLPESIIYKSNVGPNFNWQTLPPSTAGSLLTSGGPTNPPFWAPSAAAGNLASICTTIGAMLYFDTPSLLWKCLSPGTSGQLLQTGGAAGNPSWLTVTIATLGGVPSSRNINTSAPLGGGGALSADLTLLCTTCATTTNGGALSATAPETISAAGVIACPTCATTTNGGALSATAPETISAAGVIACPTCATTTNGGALSATAPETISAAGVIACATCATTTNGGALSATAPVTLSAAGVIALASTAPNVQTGNYTIATTDCGKTVEIGTGSTGFLTLTLPAPAGFPNGCLVTVKNGDTTRGKGLSGFTSDFTQGHNILWPAQAGSVQIVNSVWTTVQRPGRAKLASGTFSLFSDFTNGTDTAGATDCMAAVASACKNAENMMYMACAEFELNPLAQTLIVFNVAGNVNDTQGVHYACAHIPGGQGGAFLQVTCGTNGTFNTTNTDAFDVVTDAVVFISGCSFQATGTVTGSTRSSDCLRADYGGKVFFGGGTFVQCAGSDFAAENTGLIVLQSNYTVNGNMTNHMFTQSGGQIVTDFNTIVATFGANSTFTNWANAGPGGVINVPNWSFALAAHTATGKRENTVGTGAINTAAGTAACQTTYFPGNANGTTVTPFCN